MLTRETRLTRTADLLSSEVDGELVILDVQSGSYLNLDPVGTDIWRRLEQPLRVGDLCAALEQDYDADAATIARDVEAFVTQMLEKGLLQQA